MKPVTKELENKEKGVHNLYKNQDQLENAEPTKNTHKKRKYHHNSYQMASNSLSSLITIIYSYLKKKKRNKNKHVLCVHVLLQQTSQN